MKKKIDIYTDGSHLKGDKLKVTFGACLITAEKQFTMSGKVDVNHFHDMFGEYVSNPTAELYAVAKVLETVRKGFDLDIVILSDYNGVQKWISGEWRAKKPYIQYLLEYIHGYIKELESNGSTVTFKWIKGHDGHVYNELADELCQKEEHNEFAKFVESHNLARENKMGVSLT